MTPFVQDADFTLYVGDALDVLAGLPDESAHCCVTSPPYWGLRDYGTGTWDGGDPECDHMQRATGGNEKQGPNKGQNGGMAGPFRDVCGKCGATRVDKQLGLAATPEEYVAQMVAVFAEVRRVLRSDGTLWLNIGDSYVSQGGPQVAQTKSHVGSGFHGANRSSAEQGPEKDPQRGASSPAHFLKPKDLVGIPWRLAFALQADGWYLRSDIIWSKPNPMPESVTDRPTKAHEYLFLLTKSARYFYDADAIRESAEWARWGDQTVGDGSNPGGWIKPKTREELNANRSSYRPGSASNMNDAEHVKKSDAGLPLNPAGRNKRSVWEIATESYPEAHFATFPQALVEPCIKAGCPEFTCRTCQRSYPTMPDCGHADYQRGVVLDPFMGSGTTALVARRLGRRSIGIELNPTYARLAADRLSQLSLLAEAAS